MTYSPVMSSAYVNKTCDMILDTSAGFGSTERYLKPIVTQVSVFSLLPGNLDSDESTSRKSTAGSASDRKGRRNADAGSSLQCRLLRCAYTPPPPPPPCAHDTHGTHGTHGTHQHL